MKKFLPFLLFLFSLFSSVHAQGPAPTASPLAGTYIIGSTQTGANTFKTITAAVTEINNSGVSGPVVFLLNDASYNNSTGETFPIKINQFQGTSTVNTLTIKPNSGNNNVTITGTNINGYTALPAVFQIDGGDNIIIDGSNTANGSSRDLTVVNNDNVSYAARTAVWIASNASNGATNIKVLNLKLQMNNRNQDALQLSGIFSGSNGREGTNGLSGTTASAANSNLTVKNNEFLKIRQGIIVNGNTSPALQTANVEFSSNKLGSTVDSEKPARAIFFSSVNNFNISDNSIIGVLKNDFSSAFAGVEIENGSNYTIKRNILQDLRLTNNSAFGNGFWIKGISTNGVISENKISNIKNTGGGIIRAVTIEMDQNISSGLMIANNFISDVSSNGTTTNTGHGIYVFSGKDIRVYHNTVAMNTPQPGISAAIYLAGGTGFDVRNNIFTNLSTATQKYAIYSAVSAAAFTEINYNDYFSTPLGFLGGDKTDLPAWRAATGKDGASKNINPVFVSPSDLHLQTIAANNGLANAGSNLLAAVPIDIDGQSRTSTPEIGADEFAFVVTLANEPTAPSAALNFTNVTANSFRINWTNGNGANRIVVIRAGSVVDSPPVDATAYTANSTFGSGSPTGTGNFVVYNGSANTVDVTGLSPATTYYVSVYEYNGTGPTANYLTTAPPTGSQKTLNANLGWQISNINTLNTITFDSTVSGVNNGPFVGVGFSPAPTAGQLDSNSWSLNGFEDGAIPFGGINTNPDFGRGISFGGVSSGGVYSFKTSPNNAALGIQPSPTDFIPGNVSLRFQNQTGTPITSISIGYKVYIYNDQATSSSFNFSHSADHSNYTPISELDVISSATADPSPQWKASYRVATITGLNIPANGFYYLKWSGAAVTTGSAYDEFALDDIVLSANPSSNFASFEGTAENFSVHGNTSLSGNMTVNGDLKFTSGKLSILDKTLTLGGTVINTITGGLKGSASSNISIIGNGNKILSFDQTTPGASNMLNNFTIPFAAGSQNIVDLTNTLVINGNLNVGLEQTLNLSTTALTGSLTTITINGALRTQNTSTLPFPAGKTFGGTGTVIFDAAAAQTIVGGNYHHITVNNASGISASGPITANGTIDLPLPNANDTKGSLDMGTFTLIMGENATNTGNGDVTGIVRRNTILPNVQYTFGHPNTSILFPSVGTLPTSLGLKIQIGIAPIWKPEAVKRVYDFIQTGAAGTKAIIKAHYLDSELNGNTENKLVDWAHIFATGQTLEQGRSNYNTEENWITLTNADISRYFTSEFGKVNLTFADSKAAFLTWNGDISNSWNTVGNWTAPDGTRNDTPNRGTVIFIPNESTTPNDPLITGGQEVLSITIQEGGIVNTLENIISPPVFTVYGGAGAWINNGTFMPENSTVIFNNLDATIAGKTDFNNVTVITGAGLRPLTDNVMRIKGALSVQGVFTAGALENTVEYTGSNQTIIIPGGLAAAYHHLTISGTGAVFPTTLKVNGNLTVNKPVDFTNKAIVMSGLNLQVIDGLNAAFNNVDINNTGAGVKLGANTAVNGTLSLTNGVIDIGNFNLTLGQNPVAGSPFNVNKMIVADGAGFVRKPYAVAGTYFFPIGERTSNPAYSPVAVDITAGSFNQAFIDVSVVDAIHPNNYSLQNYISRYWNVRPTGITNGIATISASYIAAENLFPQTSMAAGQLDGSFDIQANPWKKVGTLAGTTLTATNVSLTNGQTSVFTGIKGGEFTATVNGNAVYCENETINLTSTVTGGDAPYLYLWSNSLGTESTATAPSITGTPTYTLTVTDANGLKTTAIKSIVINAAPVAGTLSTASTIACFSFAPDDIILSGTSGSVLYWERSDEISFSNPIRINNTSTTLPGSQAGEIIGVTYFRAAVSNLLCGPVFTEPIKIETKTTVWRGNAWSLGAPDLKTAAVLRSTYPFTESLSACSLLITNNASITVPAEKDVLLYGALIVDTGSSLTFKSNTNLVQVANESNFGEVKVERESSKLFRLDYTMWGSPVAPSQTLKNFSPKTISNRFYDYNSENDLFRVIPDPSTTVFTPGKGYLIRMPDNHIAYGSAVLPLSWTGTFTGIPTTGNVSIALEGSTTTGDYTSSGFNMISNPYASLVDANKFLTDNGTEIDGTLYFWRRRNNVPDASAYYATYTLAGGTASASSEIPNGFIQVGQGFIVKKATTGSVTGKALFTNAMRTAANNDNQFFKNGTPEKRDRIWLNISNTAGEFGQTLLAYMSSANNEVDRTDGKYLGDGSTALTSWINDTRYIIQGRAPFNTTDIVPLHFETVSAGSYSIAIDHVDGLFEGNQNIYLRDRLRGITHNLKNSSYTFETAAGNFNNRFEIVYADAVLSSDTVGLESNSVSLYKKDDHLFVRSQKVDLEQIEVYDMNGRLLATVKNIKGKEVSVRMGITNQMLIVRITSSEGETIGKKFTY